MAGTKEGAQKMRQKMIERHGGIDGYRAYMAEQGRKGGKAEVPKGFSMMDTDKVRAAAKKGGKISKRKY